MFNPHIPRFGLSLLAVWRAACLLGLVAGLAGCGGGGSGGGGSEGGGGGGGGTPTPPPAGPGTAGAPYFTFNVGDRWRTVEGSTTSTTRVTRAVANGLVLRETTSDGVVDEFVLSRSDTAISFVPLPGSDELSLALGAYDIARFPLQVGGRYTALDTALDGRFDLDGDGLADKLRVRAEVTVVGFGPITVPAGSFDDALHQRTVITQTAVLSASARTVVVTATSDEWYARGVGPVRALLVIDSEGVRESSDEQLQDYRVGSLSNDTVAPTLLSRTPAPGSLVSSAFVQLDFSEDIETGDTPAVALVMTKADGQTVAGRSEWRGARTLVFLPDQGGAAGDGVYSVALSAAPADWAGNGLSGAAPWTFNLDRTGPVLLSQTPQPGDQDVAFGAVMRFSFDEDLPPDQLESVEVALNGPAGQVPVSVSLMGRVLSVQPLAPLPPNQFFTLTVAGVRDAAGNSTGFLGSTNFRTTRGEPGRYEFPQALPALIGYQMDQVRLVDLDGDGRLDLFGVGINSTASRHETVAVARLADGRFAGTATPLPGPNCQALDVTPADLDADGLVDMLGSNSFCGAHWVQQQAPGSWQYQGGLGFSAVQVRPIRLVGQVRPGVVGMGNFDLNLLLLRPQGGAGTTDFQSPQVLVDSLNTVGRTLQVADVNGDGLEDIVVASGYDDQLLRVLQQADGSFTLQSQRVAGIDNVWLVDDLNGDGRADLLLQEPFQFNRLTVLWQQADGSFPATGQRYELPAQVGQALKLDVDGNGQPELLLVMQANESINNFVVFVPRVDGSFSLTPLLDWPSQALGQGARPAAPVLAAGDFSGDGVTDLLLRGELIVGRTPVAVPSADTGGATASLRALPAVRALRRLDAARPAPGR